MIEMCRYCGCTDCPIALGRGGPQRDCRNECERHLWIRLYLSMPRELQQRVDAEMFAPPPAAPREE